MDRQPKRKRGNALNSSKRLSRLAMSMIGKPLPKELKKYVDSKLQKLEPKLAVAFAEVKTRVQ